MGEDLIFCVTGEGLRLTDAGTIPPSLADEIRKVMEDLDVSPSDIHLKTGVAGHGAQVLTILAVVSGVLALGPLVKDNLEAWPAMGRRIARAIGRLRDRRYGVMISEPAALAVALKELEDSGVSLEGAVLMTSAVLPAVPRWTDSDRARAFEKHPERYYLFTIVTEENDTYVIIERSTGEIDLMRQLQTRRWLEFHE